MAVFREKKDWQWKFYNLAIFGSRKVSTKKGEFEGSAQAASASRQEPFVLMMSQSTDYLQIFRWGMLKGIWWVSDSKSNKKTPQVVLIIVLKRLLVGFKILITRVFRIFCLVGASCGQGASCINTCVTSWIISDQGAIWSFRNCGISLQMFQITCQQDSKMGRYYQNELWLRHQICQRSHTCLALDFCYNDLRPTAPRSQMWQMSMCKS